MTDLASLNERLDALIALTRQANDAGSQAGVHQEFDRTKSDILLLGGQRPVTGKPNPQVEVVRALFKYPRPATVKLQLSGPLPTVTVTVLEAIASAQFTRTFFLNAGPARTLRVFGRTVSVNVQSLGLTAGTGTINAMLTTEYVDPLAELFPTFLISNANIVAAGLSLSAFPGFLLGGEGFLESLGGADTGPYWLQFFSVPIASLVSGATAPIYKIGPLTAGAEFSFSHYQERDLVFSPALSMAFSSTPGVWTKVSSGPDAVGECDVTVGV